MQAKQYLSQMQAAQQNEFNEKLQEFRRMEEQWKIVDSQRHAELAQIKSHAREQQLAMHLQNHFISRAKIPGVGQSRISALESFGIYTARDVSWQAVEFVPGFGTELTSRLVAWRVSVESDFVFDSQKGVPQSVIDSIEAKYRAFKLQLERDMRSIPEQLLAINSQYRSSTTVAARKLAQLLQEEQQAKADLAALPSQWF